MRLNYQVVVYLIELCLIQGNVNHFTPWLKSSLVGLDQGLKNEGPH